MFDFIASLTKKHWEVLSMLLAFVGIPLVAYQHIGTWYLSLCVNTINIAIYFQRKAYAHCVGLIAAAIFKYYGVYKWSLNTRAKQQRLQITMTSSQTWFRLLLPYGVLLWVLIYGLVGYMNSFSTTKTPNLLLSSFIVAVMLLGEWLTANKKLESYIVWFGYNVISVYYHYQEIDSVFWFKYAVYTLLCVHGYYLWRKSYLKHHAQKSAPPRQLSSK